MAELSMLVELLFQENPSDDLAQRLRSESLESGLENFYAILQAGFSDLGDGKLGFESWNESQVQAVCSVASSIAYATRSFSVEHTKPIIVAILQKSLELALSFLEKQLLRYDDFNLQNNLALLLEVALLDGIDRDSEPLFTCPVNTLVQLLLSLDISCAKPELFIVKCNIQEGFSCLKEEKPVDQLFLTLISDFMHGESRTLQFTGSFLHQKLNKLVSLSQHWAVVHIGCIQRILFVFKEAIIHPDMLDENAANTNSIKKLSFSLRILKLLGNLMKYVPCIEYDPKLVQIVASCADFLPGLFRTGADSSFERLLLSTIEEFLYIVQVVFCNSSVFQNIQACIVASILEKLDFSIRRYHNYNSILKPPLAYSPQTVMFILRLVKDIKKQNWKEFSIGEIGGSVGMEAVLLSCNVHSTKVFLLQKYTVEELLKLVFPSSKQWVDSLLHLVFFLHTEGVKLRPKLEISHSCSAKSTCTSELESSVCQDDEPLFGDLFSEGNRSVVSNDDPVPPTGSSMSSCDNMPCHAATELLRFLKECILSPDCHPFLYEDACKKLNKDHIGILLSILRCQACSSEDRIPNTITSSHEVKTIGHTHKLCFELLQKIITSHILSDVLEEHLVEQILNVENGGFIYNDQALALLGHALICAGGSFGSQLRSKMYKASVDYIVMKAKSVQFKCSSFKEVLETLPSLFHIEILLMAFHLSPEDEKANLAKFVFSSIRKIDAPNPCSNNLQLSCWSLLISRLILVLRHMIYYHHTRPSSLLLDLMSRLREAPLFPSWRPVSVSNNLFFWPSSVVECLIGEDIGDDHLISSMVNQLIDVSTFPASIGRDDLPIHCLQLNWDDVYVTFLRILNAWNNNKAASVEDLIIERYLFVICWDFPITRSTVNRLPPFQNVIPPNDLSNVELFLHLSHLFFGHCFANRERIVLPNQVVVVLQRLHGRHISNNIENLGWDFLRSGLCLSFVLCLLDAGSMAYQSINAIHPPVVGHRKQNPKDDEYLTLAEGLISDIFNGSQVTDLLKIMSSLLSCYLQTYQKVFLCVLKGQHSFDGFSPLLLFKHTWFDISMQNDLLEKYSSSSCQLKSVFGLLAKLDSIIERRASGIVSEVFWQCMLHGFPSQLQITSEFLVSCILSIRGIIDVLNGFVGILGAKKNISVECDVLCQILDLVMTIKFDRVFESLHEKCGSIYHNLSGGQDGPEYTYLFPMKQLGIFLADLNASDVIDNGIHEWIVTKLIDTMNILRKDPLNAVVFKIYIGAGYDESEWVKGLYGLQRVDLLVLIDVLGNFFAESINVKVLTFFVDLLSGEFCSDFKLLIQRKFLDMDLHLLSKWLQNRLVGCIMEISGGFTTVKGSSNNLKECTMDFILCLVPPGSSDFLTMELSNHLFEAMLLTLDTAFMQFDIHTVKSYFHFVVQLSNMEHLMKSLLNRIVMLIEKLAGDEGRLRGLKFLFNFLGTVLNDCGSGMATVNKSMVHILPKNTIEIGSVASKAVALWKPSGALVLPSNQDGSTIECDATSIDEDEDDGTSDGDVAGIDRDDEDDINSERALASKVCTFTSSGSNFLEQHWYFCYTCDLVASKGCCSVCAKVCHRGHRVVYSRSSRFFCDCGAGGVLGSNCQCLKPRKFTRSNNVAACSAASFQSFLPFTEDAVQIPDSDSDMDEDVCIDVDNLVKLSIPKELQDEIPLLLEEVDVEGRVLKICSSLLPSVISRGESTFTADKNFMLGEDKLVSFGVDLLQLKKAYKSGSLDLKIKTDYSNAKDLKIHMPGGSLFKSLLSISIRGRLAVGEGDRVAIFDAGQLVGQATVAPVTADKANIKPLSKNILRFEIVHLIFNPSVDNYLAVAGYEDCQILTVNHRGEVIDRLPVELALEGAYLRRVDWVPGSQVQLLIVTDKFVKIYDLSKDNISPLHCFTLPGDLIVDATLVVASQSKFLLVLSELGNLLKLELTVGSMAGAKQLKEIVTIQDMNKPSKGLSLFYSSTYRLLFVSYQNGNTLVGRFDASVSSLTEISSIYENDQGVNLRPAGLHHWKELVCGSGLFSCFSSLKSNAALTLSIGPHGFYAQNMRHAIGSTSKLVGLIAYKPLSRDRIHLLVLHDDGSLQIYSHSPIGVDVSTTAASEKVKKLGSDILNKAYAGTNPEFPLDFFEKAVCVTADVKLSGDSIRVIDLERLKPQLSSEDGFIESMGVAGFKITVSNSNPDIVMVGIRVYVGNTSPNHIPSNITIFHRMIKFDEGMRSWYDIPFSVAESLLADEEFNISVGPTFSGSILPRIDSLEVYGRAKDEFGWKEKMETVLAMESRSQGSNSWMPGSRKKCHSMESSPIEDQVLAGGLKLLSKFYSLSKSEGCTKFEEVKVELSLLKCRQLLETIFETDREPVLQSAACLVLHAVFPKKDIYFQVKDTMRLLGVLRSTEVILSKLRVGGNLESYIIKEFTAQIHAVTRIALHRRSSLASFLEMNGSEMIDELMQILWVILDVEQLDTQTLNNIVVSSVELIYCYAECLSFHGKSLRAVSVAPAVELLMKLLFSSNEAIQTSSSLAISSRLLQVPFPRQSLLVTDDAVDNTLPGGDSSESAGVNNQVMIEEDPITSSVQYCCDGCAIVPILRQRWHCTVCPDFDLCEACYEVLDAERLPRPHSRDHPMSAIPIELDSLGGDVNEIQFSTDESNMFPVAPDTTSMQTSTPPIHVLEPAESVEFSASVVDPVLISESKQAVNSLLLVVLLEDMKGWMETTSGVQAIPVMQLFYRLSSSVGGPFINSSNSENVDMEKLIKWFLGEINLNRPFVSSSRSSFGEVTILVFMFFTLMLRNWHQPGAESSTSKSTGSQASLSEQGKNDFASQLLRACSTLRHQAFVDYLVDILQQLVHVFKSPSENFENAHGLSPGSGCGSLLTVRRDLPAGNFSPFFSDSYAKAHRLDIFVDYHRLLLENVFRLLYSLIRPEKHDKTCEKVKAYKFPSWKDLKLDGYQDVLCSYINNPHTTFVRRYARRLFLHLCGSKTHYYSVRDTWQFSSEVKKLFKHVRKCGGIQSPVPYDRAVKMVKSLSTMADVAAARPRNWQKYCLRHSGVLPFLLNGLFYFGEESVFQTLKLLNLAFFTGKDANLSFMQKPETTEPGISLNKSGSQSLDSKKKRKGEDGNESGTDKSSMDMEAAVYIFTDKGGDVLMQFIDAFLLEWNSNDVRVEAKCTLYGAWHHGKQSFKESMLVALLQKVKCLPAFGQNIVEYTELLTWLLGKISVSSLKQQSAELLDRCLTPDLIRCIFDTLHVQNELLANHPNSRIYNTLNGLIEFDGYYLESEPCVACNSPEMSYIRMKLESLKSETKFTGNRIIVKCSGSYSIQTVTMNVHDGRKSKSVKVLNLYYNNRPVSDLSELKNNRFLWKRAKSSHLAFNQTELKVDFPIPITACNLMIELDSFYENLQALSTEPLQCPRCSRSVTDKYGICGNCHENAYQCRQCRNINYENLDSFLCNECGYSKYGRFEFNFMAKPSFSFDIIENDDDMKRGLAAIESESENAHRRYQQLLGFKKPLLKIVSSIGENEMDSQQKDSLQQMMVCLPPSKINRKISLLGVLYGEKCKAAFDSVSKSVQTLQGLRRVLMNYLHQKHSESAPKLSSSVFSRLPNNCYGCATTFVAQCLEILHELAKHTTSKKQLVTAGILSELFENNIHQGPKSARAQTRAVLCSFSEGDSNAVAELNRLMQTKVMYCLEHHRSLDIALATREELLLLSDVCLLTDEFWESRLRVVFHLFFSSIKLGAKHPTISEHVILPCLRIIAQVCTPPKIDTTDRERGLGKSPLGPLKKDELNMSSPGSLSTHIAGTKPVTDPNDKEFDASSKIRDIQLLSYSEWERGATYLDFVRRQYKVLEVVRGPGQNSLPQRYDHLDLKYALRWKRRACKAAKSDLSAFELGSWVTDLVLNACSQSIRSEICMLISLLCAQSLSRQLQLLNLLMDLLPVTLSVGESAAEYFELLFKMLDSEDARLFLTVQGCLSKICNLITKEVGKIESLERSLHIDISQGFILHKLIELLGKMLEVPNIRARFLRDNLLSEVLEALIVIRGLIVQKTKLIGDCNRLLNDLLDSLLLGSSENKKQFIRACIRGLQIHAEEKNGRTTLFILEQLCNLICPSKPEPVYLLVLTKAHTQEEFMRGSMTKNPYSSAEIGPLMRDVKNKICHQLDLLGLLEDDYGMELLVAGNIISLDLCISQVYEQVWKKSNIQTSSIVTNSSLVSANMVSPARDNPPMTVTYRLQGLDGEATEPMIKELDDDREEFQDPEVEFAIAGAVREFGGLEIILGMIQRLWDDLKSNQEQLVAVLKLLMHCCKIKDNVRALLRLGALGLLLETARLAFSMDALEPAEGILLIVESLTLEANDSDDISIGQTALMATSEASGTGDQAKKIVLIFLERLSHPPGFKMSNKQQRNTEMVARILPYLTYGEPAAMDALIHYFDPYLRDWGELDRLIKLRDENPKDETISHEAAKRKFALENFVRVSESLKTSSCGGTLKDIFLGRGITGLAVRHLGESFAVGNQAVSRSSAEWASGLKLPSIPLILSMLKGLSMGHLGTQTCIDEGGILPLLHALEGVSGENEIGAKAENLLDTLSDKDGDGDGFLMEKVQKLRHATRDEMRRRALRRREEMLQGLGMRREVASDGGDRIVVSQPILEGLEDVEEEEDGVACMVCREGYSLRPSDMLGVYTYTKRVSLGVGTLGSSRGECVYTTVSHFNIIHFQCHQEAKRADADLRTPKREWEGATLRNNETLCNSLFPLRGPLVPVTQYSRYVDQYWDTLNTLGRADGTRLRLLTYDIVLMLARFATGASFSSDCKGGGKESNSRFLPFMIQMAHHLLHQGNPAHTITTLTNSISAYLSSSPSDSKSTAQETVQYMMVNSLLCESYGSWALHRRTFLQRGIHHAYMQHSHRTSSSSTTQQVGGDLLGIVQPMLVYAGLVEQLQRFFKAGESGEDWETVMGEKVMNAKELVGLGKELVTWVEEMMRAGSLYDAFRITGMLGDVLSTCEEFVQAAIDAGKS